MGQPSSPPGLGSVIMPVVAAHILTGTLYGIAFLTTLVRIVHRIRIYRFWWDDFWAAFALISGIMSCVIWLNIEKIMVSPSFTTKYFGVIGMYIGYTHSLWCSKLSVAVTVVRILDKGALKTASKYIAVLFGIAGVTLIFQKAFVCGFHFRTLPLCHIPTWTGYLELSFDITGDVWLVLGPIYILSKTNLAGAHRRLLVAVFLCGILVTVASVIRAGFIFTSQNLMMGIVGHLQLATALITCNLLVLVTFVYRRLGQPEGSVERTSVPECSINGRITEVSPLPEASRESMSQNVPSHLTMTTLDSSVLYSSDMSGGTTVSSTAEKSNSLMTTQTKASGPPEP